MSAAAPAAPAAAPTTVAPPAPAPAEGVSEQTAESTAAQAEAAEQSAPEKPAELSDKAANQEEAANDRAAQLLEAEAKPEESTEATESPETETTAEATPETEDAPQEGITALVTELFPDKQVKSDQEAMEAITDYVKESREYREQQDNATKRLGELFRGNPDLVDLIHLMNEGASMSEALPYVTGEADDTGLEGAKEGWQKTAADKRQAKAEQDKALKETTDNLGISMQNVKQFVEENNMSDDEAAEFLETLDDVMMNVSRGNITGEILTKLTKGLRYDKAIQEESEKAEVKGRNEAIKEKITKETDKKGDGIPHPSSKGTEKAAAEEVESPADVVGRGIDHFTTTRKF